MCARAWMRVRETHAGTETLKDRGTRRKDRERSCERGRGRERESGGRGREEREGKEGRGERKKKKGGLGREGRERKDEKGGVGRGDECWPSGGFSRLQGCSPCSRRWHSSSTWLTVGGNKENQEAHFPAGVHSKSPGSLLLATCHSCIPPPLSL